eukprot:gene35104-43281_t
MDVIIVGGGPVACLMALELRTRDIKVRVYEKKSDPRTEAAGTGYSFNLALTLRGMSSLNPTVRESLSKAEKLGAEFHFNHDCLKVDTMKASAKFIANDKIFEAKGNMLIGADGANSFVRYEMLNCLPHLMDSIHFKRHCLTLRFHKVMSKDEIIAAYVDKHHTKAPQQHLDLNAVQVKELLEGVTGRLQKYLQEIKDRKHPASYFHDSLDIYKYKDGLKVCAELRELTPPQEGAPLNDLLDTVFDKALPCGLMHHHPGAMAHIPTGGLVQGAVGEFITRSLNRFGGVWLDNPGFIQLETNVIHWFCSMMGYGDRSFGYLSTGGSTANLMGVVCAHHNQKFQATSPEAWTTGTSVVYSSAQCHFSTKKAAKIAGISLDNIRSIAINKDYSMNIDALIETIVADKKRGLTPTCVISTA